MRYMENTYLKFNPLELDIGNFNYVRNVTDLPLLPKIPEKYYGESYYDIKIVEDDILIEQISFEVYGTTDYWDLLLAYNGIKSIGELPVNYDILIQRVEEEFFAWKKVAKKMSFLPDEKEIEASFEIILKEKQDLNEKYRKFKYIKPEVISEVISYIESNRNKVNIKKEIIRGL